MKVKARLLCRKGQQEGNIQIVAYYKDQQKEISLGRKIDKAVWDNERGIAKGPAYQMLNVQIRNVIRDITAAIDGQIANKSAIDLNVIFNEVFGVKGSEDHEDREVTLREFLQAFIQENPDKIDQSSMNSYRTLLKSLISFDKDDVSLSNLNVDYVNRFYDFLQKAGYKSNTIQTRFKKLKKLVNTAITRGLMTEYPFGKGKLTIPSSKADKRKFLVAEEIEKLMAFKPNNETERKVMMIVRFNLHVGMRIGDVLTLRKKDVIQGEHPTRGTIFRLVKTTSKTETDINVMLTAQAAEQIVEAGYFKNESDLIFPWLKEEDFANDFILYKAISSKTTLFNKTLAQICKNVGIKHISNPLHYNNFTLQYDILFELQH